MYRVSVNSKLKRSTFQKVISSQFLITRIYESEGNVHEICFFVKVVDGQFKSIDPLLLDTDDAQMVSGFGDLASCSECLSGGIENVVENMGQFEDFVDQIGTSERNWLSAVGTACSRSAFLEDKIKKVTDDIPPLDHRRAGSGKGSSGEAL